MRKVILYGLKETFKNYDMSGLIQITDKDFKDGIFTVLALHNRSFLYHESVLYETNANFEDITAPNCLIFDGDVTKFIGKVDFYECGDAILARAKSVIDDAISDPIDRIDYDRSHLSDFIASSEEKIGEIERERKKLKDYYRWIFAKFVTFKKQI